MTDLNFASLVWSDMVANASTYKESVLAIRDLVEKQIRVYEDEVFTPYRLRVAKFESTSTLVHNEEMSAASRASLANLEALVTMDRIFIERLAMDGPQEASFCPHALFLFDWSPIPNDEKQVILRAYMADYCRFVATPMLDMLGQIEDRLIAAVSLQLSDNQNDSAVECWSNDVRAINRCVRFFSRRTNPDAPPLVFFQDI